MFCLKTIPVDKLREEVLFCVMTHIQEQDTETKVI